MVRRATGCADPDNAARSAADRLERSPDQCSSGQCSSEQYGSERPRTVNPWSTEPILTGLQHWDRPGASCTQPRRDGLISALKRSLLAGARGQAVLELLFPPSSTLWRRAQTLPRLAAVPALIRRNFLVTIGTEEETVAGRPALVYILTPKNLQAARWTVWIDQKWKVPLAYQERMPDGRLARRAELRSVNPALVQLTAVPPPAPRAGSQALRKALLSALPGLKTSGGL